MICLYIFILHVWRLYCECRFEDTGMTVKERINDWFPFPKSFRSALDYKKTLVHVLPFPIIKQESSSTVNLFA